MRRSRIVIALIVVGTMDWQPFKKERPVAIAIEAVIVDTSETQFGTVRLSLEDASYWADAINRL